MHVHSAVLGPPIFLPVYLKGYAGRLPVAG